MRQLPPRTGSFALADTTGRSQQQRPRGVGGRVGQHLRRVPDGNAAPRGVGNIDIVESDGYLADDLELRPNRIHEIAVDLVGKKDRGCRPHPSTFREGPPGAGGARPATLRRPPRPGSSQGRRGKISRVMNARGLDIYSAFREKRRKSSDAHSIRRAAVASSTGSCRLILHVEVHT